jgi:hypothetical protein
MTKLVPTPFQFAVITRIEILPIGPFIDAWYDSMPHESEIDKQAR